MVRLGPKQIGIIQDYVASLSPDDPSTFSLASEAFNPLKELIVSIAPRLLDDRAAHSLCLGAFERVAGYDNDRFFLLPPFGLTEENARQLLAGRGADIVADIKETIETLPRPYRVCIELPKLKRLGHFRQVIADHVTLVGGDRQQFLEDLSDPIAMRNYEERQKNRASMRRWETAWLEITCYGYTDQNANSLLFAEAISAAKQVVYVLRQDGAFGVSTATTVSTRFTDLISSRSGPMPLPSAAEAVCSTIVLYANRLLPTRDFNKDGTLRPAHELAEEDAQRVTALSEAFKRVGAFFACREDTDFARIATAIEWFLDAEVAENETIAYLAACIGLEALLADGDGSEIVSTQRLADRYGFILGKDAAARKMLQEQYTSVLKVRGRLVHGRVSRLLPADRPKLVMVRKLLSDLISHEVGLMLGRK